MHSSLDACSGLGHEMGGGLAPFGAGQTYARPLNLFKLVPGLCFLRQAAMNSTTSQLQPWMLRNASKSSPARWRKPAAVMRECPCRLRWQRDASCPRASRSQSFRLFATDCCRNWAALLDRSRDVRPCSAADGKL